MALAFAYNALPWAVFPPTATKPLMPSAFFAAEQAFAQACSALPAKRFLLKADAAFETILPCLFFTSWLFVRPPPVFSLLPRNTENFLRTPVAILLTFMAFFFITVFFMAFFFIAVFFIPVFIATFIPFIAAFMAARIATMFRKGGPEPP